MEEIQEAEEEIEKVVGEVVGGEKIGRSVFRIINSIY